MTDEKKTGMPGYFTLAAKAMPKEFRVPVPPPACPKCGYIQFHDGECVQCKEIAAQAAAEEAKRVAWDIKRLGGLKAYQSFTFDSYDNRKAIEECYGYPDCNLYLYGPAGVGKTHLATAIVRSFPNGIVCKPAHIFRKTRGLKDGKEEQEAIDRIAAIKHLVIDDLGVGGKTDFSLSVLYEVIESRDMAMSKGLIVTSNLSLDQLAERLGDDRVTSRLAGMCRVVGLGGKDRRIKG